jgi:D-alanine--poly(phosphoribitol) ligase subunit 1
MLLYRTGDRVREDEKGQLWFHGRIDNQVKIRGHRIELEEVDLAVQSLSGIRRAVAVVLQGVDGDEIAVAFAADRAVAAEEIRTCCSDKLPAYMCPAKFIQLDDLPRNANGKVDRKAARTLLQQMA